MMTKGSSLNLVYGIEYYDEEDMEYFHIYHTIFRNVPLSQLNRLNDKEFQKRIKTYCDKHYTESAVNATGSSKVEMIHGDKYYETYEDSLYIYLVMEYINGGELFEFICK